MRKVGVVSGKGGVGKTTVAVSLAVALARRGFRVGLLDLDLTGSNVHDVLGKNEVVVSERDTFIPSTSMGVKYISLGQIVSDGMPVLWDPKDIRSAARQLLERTEWGELDFLVCDFPPGFEAETLEMLPLMDYVLIVTTPSALSKSKVDRMIEAAREYQIPIIGVVKNMSYVVCPRCGYRFSIFSEDYGFEEYGIPVIAEFPLSEKYAKAKIIEDFPIDNFLKALEKPVLLRKKPRTLRRRLVEALLKTMR